MTSISFIDIAYSVPTIKKGITSTYSLIKGTPKILQNLKSKDKETAIEDGLYSTQLIINFIETRAAVFTTISSLFSKLLSFQFSYTAPPPMPLFSANVTGLVGCTVDALIESRGIFRCNRFLKRNFSNEEKELGLFLELHSTKKIKDPAERKEQRLQIIHRLIPQLTPTPLTQKIDAVFERVVREETTTYVKLERQIETAVWFTKLKKIETALIGIDLEKENQIREQALKIHPYDPKKREAFLLKKLTREEKKKALELNRCIGAPFSEKFKTATSPLLKNLLSDHDSTAIQALADTKKLLLNTQLQAKKLTLIHTIGLIAAVTTSIAFILSLCVVCAPAIPLLIGIVGTILYTVRYLLFSELLENDEWKFSLKSAAYRAFVEPFEKHITHPIKNQISKIRHPVYNGSVSMGLYRD